MLHAEKLRIMYDLLPILAYKVALHKMSTSKNIVNVHEAGGSKKIRNIAALVANGLAKTADISWLKIALEKFALAIPSAIAEKIKKTNSAALIAQFVPSADELEILTAESSDPISDDKYAPVRGIVHRYPDRCLLTPIFTCPVYCRFCFRKEKVGKDKALSQTELNACFEYIASNNNIWEVILTGGEPLMLKPKQLQEIIKQLTVIPHVEVIRIHTKVPVVAPESVNEELLEVLKLHRPIYMVLHVNHVDEFSAAAESAIARIIDSGVPMLSQSVLLKGVNDDAEILGKLLRKLVKNRIKPYYLHHPDMVKGTSKFRGTISRGQKIMRELRGSYSGLCQPTYVLDIPGGHGKSPISKEYIKKASIKMALGDKCQGDGEDMRCEHGTHSTVGAIRDDQSDMYEVVDYNGVSHSYEG